MWEHHVGKCVGGPYNGQFRDYFQSTMPVFSFLDNRNTGEYKYEPPWEDEHNGHAVGRWIWRDLACMS